MIFYALGTAPLVNILQITSPEVRQVYLADDTLKVFEVLYKTFISFMQNETVAVF